jgi:hypothetical protein
LEAWGEFRLITFQRGRHVNLLTWQSDLAGFGEWFARNYDTLHDDELCVDEMRPDTGESVAEALDRLYDRDFPNEEDEDRWSEAIEKYAKAHSLRAAFPGTPIPPIYLGLNRGRGEISLNVNAEQWPHIPDWLLPNVKFGPWAYQFDMDAFCAESKTKVNDILDQWYAEAPELDTKVRAASLLQKLEQLP